MEKQREPQETTMPFRPADLQEAFFVPGTYAFRVWGYGTVDALEEVLRPGYFAAAGALLRAGELIYISAQRQQAPGPARALDAELAHLALLMVARAAARGGARSAPAVRLVQDFGGPEDSAQATIATAAPAPAAPIKRGRGRPPGSRTRKNGALPTLSLN
jgi:hypothetical protein